MRAHEFIKPLLLEYKRDITLRQYGGKILNAWKNGADSRAQSPHAEFTILGLDDNETTDEAIVNRIISYIEQSDPTPNKIYTPWLAREYAGGNIKRIEDLSGYTPVLRDYNRYKSRGDFPQHAKDIMRLSASLDARVLGDNRDNSFWVVMQGYKPPERENIPKGKAKTVYEDGEVRVIHPQNEEAAIYYGQGTRWCTAATQSKNYFNTYNEHGPMYILIPKKPQHQGEKYQIHLDSGQFMDENDNHVGIDVILRERFPQVIPVLRDLGEPLDDYISLLDDVSLMQLFRAGAKLIVDNISDRIVDSGYREIPIEYYKGQLEEWFDDYRTAGNIRIALNQMNRDGDEVGEYYRFPRLFSHIISITSDDYETHNNRTRDPDNVWTLYIDYDDSQRIKQWITTSIRIVTNGGSGIPEASIKELVPVEGTTFTYILLNPVKAGELNYRGRV